jgi:hypothetical protein
MREILNKILEVSNQELNSINYYTNGFEGIISIGDNFKGYFIDVAGREHYRLLSYISSLFNGEEIFDVGTYKGLSALALAYNPCNKIISYDIAYDNDVSHVKNSNPGKNIEFNIGNALNDKRILNSRFIMLDTAHDGVYEVEFIDFLIRNKWKGLLFMDDIKDYPALQEIWQNLPNEKYDLIEKGHYSGTGLVVFSGE